MSQSPFTSLPLPDLNNRTPSANSRFVAAALPKQQGITEPS
jgi:hypothetical protein